MGRSCLNERSLQRVCLCTLTKLQTRSPSLSGTAMRLRGSSLALTEYSLVLICHVFPYIIYLRFLIQCNMLHDAIQQCYGAVVGVKFAVTGQIGPKTHLIGCGTYLLQHFCVGSDHCDIIMPFLHPTLLFFKHNNTDRLMFA